MIISLLSILAATGSQGYDAQPRFTEAQRASVLALTQKIERPDVGEYLLNPGTKLVCAAQGDAGIAYSMAWRGDNPSLGTIGIDVAQPSGQIVGLDLSRLKSTARESNPSESDLAVRAEVIARRLFSATPLLRVRYEDSTLNAGVEFNYYPQGSTKEGSDRVSVFLHPRTAQVLAVFVPFVREDEHYNGYPVLAPELLESRALSLYADARPFPQGEIVASYVYLGVPSPYELFPSSPRIPTDGVAAHLFSPVRNSAYVDLARRKSLIPIYRLKVTSPHPAIFYQVYLDARDGHLIMAMPVGGGLGGGTQTPQALPTRVTMAGYAGLLTALNRESASPSGMTVAITANRRVLAGRFQAKSGTLWLQRTTKEPYQAFRPEPKLRKALEAQVKRNAALTKKGVRPG